MDAKEKKEERGNGRRVRASSKKCSNKHENISSWYLHCSKVHKHLNQENQKKKNKSNILVFTDRNDGDATFGLRENGRELVVQSAEEFKAEQDGLRSAHRGDEMVFSLNPILTQKVLKAADSV